MGSLRHTWLCQDLNPHPLDTECEPSLHHYPYFLLRPHWFVCYSFLSVLGLFSSYSESPCLDSLLSPAHLAPALVKAQAPCFPGRRTKAAGSEKSLWRRIWAQSWLWLCCLRTPSVRELHWLPTLAPWTDVFNYYHWQASRPGSFLIGCYWTQRGIKETEARTQNTSVITLIMFLQSNWSSWTIHSEMASFCKHRLNFLSNLSFILVQFFCP